MTNKHFLLLCGFFFCVFCVFSQNKEALQEKKAQLEKEIEYTNKLLETTKQNKDKSLGYLKTLNKQINTREKLLQTLNTEVQYIENKIINTERKIKEGEEKIEQKKQELHKLQEDYAKMVYHAQRNKLDNNFWIFVFSAESINQAYKRMQYLKQYARHRQNQAQLIVKTQHELAEEIKNLTIQQENLEKEKEQKQIISTGKKKELDALEVEKNDQKQVIEKIKKSEKQFKQELQKQQAAAKELDGKIRKIIEEEIRKEREKNKTNNTTKTTTTITPESGKLTADFVNNKGKLPWPSENGVIIKGYGVQKHPVFAGVETFSNGIDIATDRNTVVRTVFDGTVSRIFVIKGEGKVVLINHGEYYSVYSGLKEVSVQTGQKVITKQKIGVVETNEAEQKTEIHFEIWKGYDKQNPTDWLYRAK